MKRIIEGLRFDTEKSHAVCAIWEGTGRGDFHCLDCTLYVTPRSHRFFLAGWGGAMTRFATKTSGNTWTGDEKIIPLEVEEARAYAEKYAAPEVVEKYFKVEEA